MASAPEPADNEKRLSDMIRSFRGMLQRRWKTLALAIVVSYAILAALIMLLPPKYEATTRVRIDPSRSPLSSSTDDQTSLGSEAIETEVSVLSSPELAREVVRRLDLVHDTEFSKGITDDPSKPITPAERLNRITTEVMRHLSVSREKLTYIIAIDFQSRDAEKAADIANAFAKTYIETRVDSRIGTAGRQAAFYARQLDLAGKELNDAQQREAQFRANSGIVVNGTAGTVTDQQVAPLSTQLATVEAAAAEARSNYEAARRQVAAGGLEAVSAVRSSPVISELRSKRAEVQRNKQEIEARYGPKHPESVKVRDQLAAIDSQIDAEARRAIGSLEAEARAADAQVASLRGTLQRLKGQQAAETRASSTVASLDQDVANKKQAYDRLAQAALESSQSQRNSIAQAEIIDRAQAPTQAAAPRRGTLLALAGIVALAIGMILTILLEMLSAGLRSIEDVEARFGIPVLGSLPRLRGRGINPAAALMADSTSMYAEVLRNARSSIVGVQGGQGPIVVAITSALPYEGKSTAALSLARVSGLGGTRTLLIECDVRRARLSTTADAAPTIGLVEVLEGGASVDQAIVHDHAEGLDLLLVRDQFFSPKDLFGNGKMAQILQQLRSRYQFIVLDLPPVLGLADSRTVSALADSVVFVIRWGSTPVPAVERALSALHAGKANVVGALFTMVDPRSEAIGGIYYSKRYAGYYTAGK